jgi:hypothetical protein
MESQFYTSGNSSGFQYENRGISGQSKGNPNQENKKRKDTDEDLIIEENTVYEIDRECYEKLKRQRKRKE